MGKHTEALIKVQYERYQEYLKNLDEEFLAYEFNDRMGCDPIMYYSSPYYWDDKAKWIDTLEDSMANKLYDDPEYDPVNKEYLEACK